MKSTIFNLGTGVCIMTMLTLMLSCAQKKSPVFPGEYRNQLSTLADQAAEGFIRSNRYIDAWLEYADPISGLLPRRLYGGHDQDIWNARDCAADNYPFLVLTSFFTDQSKFNGVMRDLLRKEIQLTSRVKSLPDTWSFSKKDFDEEEIDMNRIIFGTAEYMKDGLLPLTEWLGKSPWYDRMLTMLHDLDEYVDVAGVEGSEFGMAPKAEVNGELLQVLSRMYWMTGEDQLLNWAVQIGDYYLLGDGYPLTHLDYLRLRDHGCELVAGLCGLYTTLHFTDPEKHRTYQEPLYRLLDHILENGRNEDGLFFNAINPQTGAVVDSALSDGWGYMLNGYYSVYMVDSVEAYKNAILKLFENLHKYHDFNWESNGADGYADAIEGAINLYNRLPEQSAADWIDREIRVMWSMQDSSHRENALQWKGQGIIEGWYGDGNFARTSIMNSLWKTQGTYVQPWNPDLRWAAIPRGDSLFLTVHSPQSWNGRLYFDEARHKVGMQLPVDWPRINQFPEWFVVQADKTYQCFLQGEQKEYSGQKLVEGIRLNLSPGETLEVVIVAK